MATPLRQCSLGLNALPSSSSSSSSSSSPSSGGQGLGSASNALVVIDLLYHISSFAKVLSVADPLEIIGTQNERSAFLELKNIFSSLLSSSQGENINVQPFLDKLGSVTNVDYSKNDASSDILSVWDDIVKLVMVVIPPLREVFLGQVASAQEVPGWLNLMSRCFRANFTDSTMTLEDVCRLSLQQSPSNALGLLGSTSVGGGGDGCWE